MQTLLLMLLVTYPAVLLRQREAAIHLRCYERDFEHIQGLLYPPQ